MKNTIGNLCAAAAASRTLTVPPGQWHDWRTGETSWFQLER